MIKYTALFIIILNSAFGEISFPDSAFNHTLSIKAGYSFASNSITNDFATSYFLNEFISESDKDHVSEKLKDHNRFGAHLRTQISYLEKTDSMFNLKNSFFGFAVRNINEIDCEFKRDVFELYFRGNKNYEGKSADLGDFVLSQLYYQQFSLQFGHEFIRNSSRMGWMIGLSLNKGQQVYRVDAGHATLFTHPFGTALDADVDLTIERSDSAKKDIVSWNGTGGSMDLSAFWMDDHNNRVEISASNFGFITWNERSSRIKSDTAFRFEGVDVTHIFEFRDSVENISLDSSLTQPFLSNRVKKSFTIPVPANASIIYTRHLRHNLEASAGLSYLFFAGARVKEMISVSYHLNPYHRITVMATNGEHTGLQFGLGYETTISHFLSIHLESEYLSGFFNPSEGTAQSVSLGISAHF